MASTAIIFLIRAKTKRIRIMKNRLIKRIGVKLRINSSRRYLDEFARQAGSSVASGSLVLDAGAGSAPYKHHFSDVLYESADFGKLDKNYCELTYRCDLSNIPVEDQKYDLVFCSQTLEHLPEPQAVLREFNRVLKPEGKLWLSAPLFYEEHETPYDFYRYTQYGLRHLFQLAGFKILRIEWLEGYSGTLSYQLEMAARKLPWAPRYYGGGAVGVLAALFVLTLKPVFAALSLLFSRLDLRTKITSLGQCKNYTVIAVKEEKQSE